MMVGLLSDGGGGRGEEQEWTIVVGGKGESV